MSEYERMYETYRQQKNEDKARQIRQQAVMQARIEQLERELAECRRADVNLQMLEALEKIADYQFNCCDRDEIEDAQKIARAAIDAAKGE